MAVSSFHVKQLLDKMGNPDKDFRFMATSDLMAELAKGQFNVDEENEKKLVLHVLKQMEDKSVEVQNLSVKCLACLARKVQEKFSSQIIVQLCTYLTTGKDDIRDIAGIALKAVITDLSPEYTRPADTACQQILQLLSKPSEDYSLQTEALDILTNLLQKFGQSLSGRHTEIATILVSLLDNPRHVVRKHTITTLGQLVTSASPQVYSSVMTSLLNKLVNSNNLSEQKTYLQATTALFSRGGGSAYLPELLPVLARLRVSEDDELKEICTHSYETLFKSCSKEMTPEVESVCGLCMNLLSYDPNYNYDDDEDMEEEEDDEEENYSDEDDLSWKVRRAATKCLEAIFVTQSELLPHLLTAVGPGIVTRFREREESVRIEILQTFAVLLKLTRYSYNLASMQDSVRALTPAVVVQMGRLLRQRSPRTRLACFQLLAELTQTVQNSLQHELSTLLPTVTAILNDTATPSNLKLDCISFAYHVITNHDLSALLPHANTLATLVFTATGSSFYKLNSEGLRLLAELVKITRPIESADPGMTALVQPAIDTISLRLKSTDCDQEVKDRAILTMGHLLAHYGDSFGPSLAPSTQLLLEKLNNDVTRLDTIKSLIIVSRSPRAPLVYLQHSDTISILSTFLRKSHRVLRINTLQLLRLLFTHPGVDPATASLVVAELPPLISDSDLHISQLTLALLTALVQSCPDALRGSGADTILPSIRDLCYSPVLQGQWLESLVNFLALLAAAEPSRVQGIIDGLSAQLNSQPIRTQIYFSVAKSCASLATGGNCPAFVSSVVSTIGNTKASDNERYFALLAVGELGKNSDLSAHKGLADSIVSCFEAAGEDIRLAASSALGGLACGNPSVFLPFLLRQIEQASRRQYLLLHGVKELLTRPTPQLAEALAPFFETVWRVLVSHAASEEEGTRNIVSECQGRLVPLAPDLLLPQLVSLTDSKEPLEVCTAISAAKFALAYPDVLAPYLDKFLRCVSHPEISVRRSAILLLSAVAHTRPSFLDHILPELLPSVYIETKIRPELVKEVAMGPFKHSVDDGLPTRMAAYECLLTLMLKCTTHLEMGAFMQRLQEGLDEHYDMKMLCHLILIQACRVTPGAVTRALDALLDPLKKTCNTKPKQNAVRGELEKLEELKRSALRAFNALLQLPSADKLNQLVEFQAVIKSNVELAKLQESAPDSRLSVADAGSIMET